ncbi:hypothetical protein [Mucilaginibacter lappiensis]|uniref:Uncharacterized protein n=1 Tax=Mucilaginibacter lappiensis TaxID=354630 RepID=A0A841JPP9_9SPHI|nr:hypothetical protein [Mucilaginibacter lappiensis]MBB6130738.1 hypothetical protein [Mucilaginibacter lappiensis]
MNTLLAEFQFSERKDSRLKISYEQEIIPILFDYAVHIAKGDHIDFWGNSLYPDLIPFFWLGDAVAFQNICDYTFVVTDRFFFVEIDEQGNQRNALRIVLEQGVL